jgi:hypothetical protein
MRVSIVGALLMLPGCVFDEIAITVSVNGMHPSFGLRYVREADVPVGLSEFSVKELKGGRVIWRLRVSNWETEPLRVVVVKQITFGVVPEGFVQHFPSRSQMAVIQDGMVYIAEAGGAVEGRTEFTTIRECRKVPLTSFSRESVEFKVANPC